jgi:hypothetical protein
MVLSKSYDRNASNFDRPLRFLALSSELTDGPVYHAQMRHVLLFRYRHCTEPRLEA